MLGIVYLSFLLFGHMYILYKTKGSETYKEALNKYDYSFGYSSLLLTQVILALMGVYSSFNIFALFFLVGFIYHLVLSTIVYYVKDTPKIDTIDKFIIPIHESLGLDEKFEYKYTQVLFSFIINILLVIGFYMNVKGGH